MTRDHEETFVREGMEQITELNNSLLALEEDPGDEAVVDRCFRCAHTLKGNFAAQGYDEASDLAHAMEDLLDDIRDGDRGVDPDLMDRLFAGVDALEARLDAIEAGAESFDDLDDLIARLRSCRTGAPDAPTAGGGGVADPDQIEAGEHDEPGDQTESLSSERESGHLEGVEAALDSGPVVRARIDLDASEVPGAAGMLVLQRLADRFEVVDTDPPTDAVNDGRHDGRVDVFVEGGDETALREAASALPPVESVSITKIAGVDRGREVAPVDDSSEPSRTEPADEPSRTEPADEPAQSPSGSDATAASDPDEGRLDTDSATTEMGVVGRARSLLSSVVRSIRGTTATDGVRADGQAQSGESVATPNGGSTTAQGNGSSGSGETAAIGDGTEADAADDATQAANGVDGDGRTNGTGPGTEASEQDPTSPASGRHEEPDVDEISSVRVDVERLDELYGLVERLVTNRIKLRNTFEDAGIDPGRDLQELDKVTNNLQDTVMEMRLVPMNRVVERIPRIVRDLAREQQKEVTVEMSGTDVELDRRILDRISDPLVHIVRNAVDHGIEPPEERVENDKPREGTVEVTARRERDTVVITVADDGRGIDPDEVRRTALERGIRTERELDAMDDAGVFDLVFHPGFSTNEEVTEVSGRGVGMDVVYNTVSRLDGSVSVESTPGEGTEVTLRLPVSVAIVDVLFVRVDGDRVGIPIKKIDRVTHAEGIETVNGTELVDHGDGLVPLVRLHEALDTLSADAVDGDGMLVRIRESERPIALYCDEIVGYEEVVVKPLDGVLGGTPGLSGTAVLGEGDIVPVLDVTTI